MHGQPNLRWLTMQIGNIGEHSIFCVQPRPVLPAAEIRRESCCCRLHNYEYFPLFGSVSKTVTINRVG